MKYFELLAAAWFVLVLPGWVLGQSRAGKPAPQAEWEQVLVAAKKEGKIVVLGPPGPGPRHALADVFQKKFPEIQIEYSGAPGPKHSPRLLAERKAGQYLADVYVGSSTVSLETLRPAGAIDPITPALILPEVLDPSKWWQGKLDFSDDDEKYNLVFSTNVKPPMAINPRVVKKDQIRSYWDLLDPRWGGKIVIKDPLIAGPGSVGVIFWYLHGGLGKEFIRKFFGEQKVTLTRDDRQLLEWVARGDYPVGVAHSDVLATDLIAKGLPIEPLGSEQFKEGSYITSGFGTVALVNRAPHPNAAKIYTNWLLSKEGQTEWSRAAGYTSRRLDVARDHLDPAVIPKEGVAYMPTYKEKQVLLGKEVDNFLQTVIRQ